MTKMKNLFLLMIICVIILSSCDLLTGPDDSPVRNYQNLVAFIAMFEEKNEHGEVTDRSLKAVVADFYNTTNYEIIVTDTVIPWPPRFSRDKKKITIYGGFWMFTDPETICPVILHDIEKNESDQLQVKYNDYLTYQILTKDIIWNYEGTGFYHSSHGYSLAYYEFETQTTTNLNSSALRPWGIKGQDTLLVLMDDLTDAYLDLSGNVIGNIDNPYFEYVREGTIMKKAALYKDWNDELGLVVYLELNSDEWKLSITNLDGTYYRSLLTLESSETYPVWGPENRYILYEQNGQILVYDLETDETRYLVTSAIIKGATSFRCPEF